MSSRTFPHQLHDRPYYVPDWPLQHLFIGTFNPSYGRRVGYYYGRCENRAWELLSDVFGVELDPNMEGVFLDKLRELRIGCMDMIQSVEFPAGVEPPHGYRDADIINGSVKRTYNTEEINRVIEMNRDTDVKVYSTWGKGPTLQEWNQEVEKIGSIAKLVSPSMVAWVPKGTKKYDHMLKDWSENINP